MRMTRNLLHPSCRLSLSQSYDTTFAFSYLQLSSPVSFVERLLYSSASDSLLWSASSILRSYGYIRSSKASTYFVVTIHRPPWSHSSHLCPDWSTCCLVSYCLIAGTLMPSTRPLHWRHSHCVSSSPSSMTLIAAFEPVTRRWPSRARQSSFFERPQPCCSDLAICWRHRRNHSTRSRAGPPNYQSSF